MKPDAKRFRLTPDQEISGAHGSKGMDHARSEPPIERFLRGLGAKAKLRLLFGAHSSSDIYIAIILVLLLLLGQAAEIAF